MSLSYDSSEEEFDMEEEEDLAEDAARLLEMNKARGFPGMLGSIDCVHWSWKICPKVCHGQFHGQNKGSTIILEAVADQETWIWHAFIWNAWIFE